MLKIITLFAALVASFSAFAQNGYWGTVHPDAPGWQAPNYNEIRRQNQHLYNQRYQYIYNSPSVQYSTPSHSSGSGRSSCTMRMPSPYPGYSREPGAVIFNLNLRQVTTVQVVENQVIVQMAGSPGVQMGYAGHWEARSVERSILQAIEACHNHRRR